MQELGLNCSSKLYEALDSKQQEIILTYNWSVDLSICTMVYVLSKCEFCCTQMATQVLCNQGVICHCLIPWIFRIFFLVILHSTKTKSLTPCHRIYSIITCCCDWAQSEGLCPPTPPVIHCLHLDMTLQITEWTLIWAALAMVFFLYLRHYCLCVQIISCTDSYNFLSSTRISSSVWCIHTVNINDVILLLLTLWWL